MNAESTNLSAILRLNDSYNSSSPKQSPTKSSKIPRSKSEKQTGIKKKLQPGLNDWEYSKPDHLEDKLPQPFRFINRIIYKDLLLRKVFSAIDDIEKSKLHHNYEGKVHEVNPVSFIEIDGTSVLCYPQFNPINIVVTGDKYGNINILDLNRRIQLLKKEVSPAHRIIALDAVMIEYCDDHMITIAVASRGENVIQIWRTRARDYNPVLAARIQTARATPTPFTPQTRIDEFPCKLKFSDDGLFLAVTLYNGSVELYQVPEPPLILPVAEESELASPGSLSHVKSSSQIMESSRSRTSPSKSEISPQKQSHVQQNLSDIPTQDLSIFKRIPLRAPEKKINMEQALVQALLGNASSQGEKTPAIKEEKDKKASKKDTKKEEPKSQKKAIDGQEKLQFQSQTPGFESNEELFLGETISNPDFDVNPDPQHPKFYPDVFFNSVTLSFQPDRKRFLEKEITTTITTGITCVWHETCFAEVFEFQLPIPENAPTYFSYKNRYNLYHQLNRRKNYLEKSPIEVKPPETKESSTLPKKDSKKEGKKEEKKEEKKETAPKPNENTGKEKVPAGNSNPLLKPWKTFETIYPIKTSAVSKMKGFLALGLADGSILVLETIEYSQRYLLDKHIGPVTKISFLDEWHLISGSADGGVHFHKIQGNTGELQCKKYQHVFKTQGNSIVDIQMNDFGLGFVVDNQGNTRCYDLYHFEKIMRLNTKSSYAKSCKFSVWPRPLMSTGNEQFIAVCDVVDPELSEKEREVYSIWEKKTMILVYRTFETLTELFPGLANLAKKGVEKTKLMTAFGKISFKDLQDPKYEIPQFKTETESVFSHPCNGVNSNKSKSKIFLTEGTEPKLTQEVLHPEQYFYVNNPQPGPVLVDSLKNTLSGVRAIISDKINRTERLQNYYVFLQKDLELREHELILRRRQEQILKEISKYK